MDPLKDSRTGLEASPSSESQRAQSKDDEAAYEQKPKTLPHPSPPRASKTSKIALWGPAPDPPSGSLLPYVISAML